MAHTPAAAALALSFALAALASPTLSMAAPTPAPTPSMAAPTPDPTPEPTPPAPSVEIVYTGLSGGVGSGLYPLELLRRLLGRDDAPMAEIRVIHGLAAQGPWALRSEDGSVVGVLRLLAKGAPSCDPPQEAWAVVGETETVVGDPGAHPPWLDALSPHATVEAFQARRCTSPEGEVGWLLGPAGVEALPDFTLTAFELRLGLRLETAGGEGLTLVGVPVQEASRTFRRLKDLEAAHPEAVYVDAGDWVDGVSTVEPGEPSLHRPLRYDMLSELNPQALVPGHNELALGAAGFFKEIDGRELPYVAANWRPRDAAWALPPWRLVEVPSDGGVVRVAFVGLLDPELLRRIPKLKDEGVGIDDPVAIMPDVIAQLAALPAPPDLVVALTTARGEVQEDIRRRVRGVDLLLGDSSLATLRVAESTTDVRPLARDVKGAALTLPMDGVGVARVRFDRGRADGGHTMTQAAFTPELVRGDLPLEPASAAAITRVRAESYPLLDHPLMTTPDPTRPLTASQWAQLLCQATLTNTRADLVLLRPPPRPPAIPGVLTELYLLNQLPVVDLLEEHEVSGAWLSELLKKLYGTDVGGCGTDLSQSTPTVRGRAIDADRTYRLVTTDQTRRTTPLGPLLEGIHSSRPLDQPSHGLVRDVTGQVVTLQLAVAEGLREIRDEEGGPGAVAGALLARSPSWRTPQWVLRVRQLSFQAQRFRGTGNPAFDQIPETLAVSPSSFTLGSGADVGLDYVSDDLYADARFRSSFSTLRIEGGEAEETADDWELASSLSLPKLTFPAATQLRVMPFSELSLDSEFTPSEQEDGTLNPRQADLYLTFGLSALRLGPLRSLRFGAFANQDLARLGDKPLEYGGRLVAETLNTFGPSLRLSTFTGARVFAKTKGDDPSDLRFKALAEARLSLPLSTWLDASLFAQGFALMGRVPETAELGLSWNVGVSLDVRGALLL